MSSKINIVDIISDHLGTLRNEATNRVSKLDLVTFFGIGLGAAGFVLWKQLTIPDDAVNVMVAAFSIFAGLLINVLVLIFTVSQRSPEGSKERTPKQELERRFLTQIFANLSFSIFVSVLAVGVLTVSVFLSDWLKIVAAAVVTFLTINFMLTLLMALKRLHILLGHHFKA